jgi:hypothetical protein
MSKALVTVDTPIGALRVKDDELRLGNLSLIKGAVTLDAGTDYTNIQGKLLCSPQGADRRNHFAGLSVFEDRVGDEIEEGGFLQVQRRCIVAGYTPTGKMQVVTSSITFSPRAYFLHALAKTVRYNRGAGRIGTADNRPAADKDGTWIFYPVDDSTGIWADLNHKDVFGKYEAYLQDKKFADRRAAGIVRRNALCQHAAMGGSKMLGTTSGKDDTPDQFKVTVFSWRGRDLAQGEDEARALVEAVERGDDNHPALKGGTVIDAPVYDDDIESAPIVEDASDAPAEDPEASALDLPPMPGVE